MIPNAAIGNTQIAINLNPKNLIFFALFVSLDKFSGFRSCLAGLYDLSLLLVDGSSFSLLCSFSLFIRFVFNFFELVILVISSIRTSY